MEKILVKNSCIIINDYNFGDSPKLESFFAIYNPTTHSYRYAGIYYNAETKQLYLPRGIDVWYIENLLGEKATVEINKYYKYDTYNDIGIRFLPKDNDQKKALRFAVGKGEYLATSSKSQLSINLNTGKGKTYVAIGTISFLGIKSIVITYAKTVLEQWKKCILDYTNIEPKEIYNIDGSGSIFLLLNKSPKEIKKIKIFLVTHSTLKSYGDKYGWDKVGELFAHMKVGLKFYDEAHTNFDNMCMIDFFTSVYKTYYLTATPARSNNDENRIYQTSFKNTLAIDLFHPNTDPHTHYIAVRYNSRPSPQIISFCKNKYGLDRNKYTNYIIKNDNFKKISVYIINFIMTKILKTYNDKLLIYIGTNNAIAEFYNWIISVLPMLNGQIGIFSSMVSDQDKQYALSKRIILTTTKSAGAAIDIHGLKCTLVLAEPFKSEVLARQTLGRTRDNNTYYIEIVDKGFKHCNGYFLAKRQVFSKYALDSSLIDVTDAELENIYSKIMISRLQVKLPTLIRPFKIRPFVVCDKSYEEG